MEEEQILETLNLSVQEVIKRNKAGYQVIYALLISWEEKDDAGIDAEIDQLRDILEGIGAVIDDYRIPSKHPQIDVQETLTKVYRTYQDVSKNCLFVLYYSGHGDRGGSEKRSRWTA
jgi:hypothetical protein